MLIFRKKRFAKPAYADMQHADELPIAVKIEILSSALLGNRLA